MNLTKKVNFGLQELELEEVDIVNVVDSSKCEGQRNDRDSLEVDFSLQM